MALRMEESVSRQIRLSTQASADRISVGVTAKKDLPSAFGADFRG